MTARFPTPYPDVNEIVNTLLAHVQRILGDELIGMYLHGSLANGGFDEFSDIDVVFVTKEELSEEMLAALHAMHTQMSEMDSAWAVQQEVSYIPQAALRRFDRANMHHPHLDRGKGEVLHRMDHESDWVIQRHILRERGIVVSGPDPKTLIDPISPNDLRMAVVEGLPLWLNPMLKDPTELNQRGPQSFFVLSLCRMLYTLERREILSKQVAAQWALENLEARWKPLIERALIGRHNPDVASEPEDIRETLQMMRYTLQQIPPTPYAEVNELLAVLKNDVEEILGPYFVGMYLYGSLATGDFDLQTSDIDFLIVTSEPLTVKKIMELEQLHRRLWDSPVKWAAKLEGSYVDRELIRRHDPNGAPCPTINEGKFFLDRRGSDWVIQRHVIRGSGVILAGPDPQSLIDPVSPDELRSAIKGVLHEWWFPMLQTPARLAERGTEYHAYAILSMCRALHAIEYGTIVSKLAAARWAQVKLGGRWADVIQQALTAQRADSATADLLTDALELIRYAKEALET
jgi:predicted nucleotidyltransferase